MIAVYLLKYNMNKEDIILKLKQIKYPGYNRDIVSFGIVKDLTLSDSSINLELTLQAEDTIIDQIRSNIYSILKQNFNNLEINIKLSSIENNQKNIVGDIKALKDVKNIIAIASGKGGVGKSTTTVNLASVLSESLKVGILDLDIYGPSLPTALGCSEKPNMNSDNLLVPIKKHGMKLMSFGFLNEEAAPTIWRGPMVSRMTQQFFEQVDWGELDVLLLDLPPGTGDIQLTLVQKIALSGALIITTPQDLALLDVKKASDMFNKLNTPILGVIENMSNLALRGHIKDLKGELISGVITINDNQYPINNGSFSIDLEIFKGKGGYDESHRLNVPLLSQIPIDSDLALCTDKGTPYVYEHKNTYTRSCYKKIADIIIDKLEK